MYHYARWLICIMVFSSLCWAQSDEEVSSPEIALMQKKIERLEHRVDYLAELLDQANIAELEEKVAQLQSALAKRSQSVSEPSETVKKTNKNEDKAYQDIKNMLSKQDYKRAQVALKRFIEQYPNASHHYHAMFELANLMVLQGDLLNAEPLFVKVAAQKRDTKAPDAMLRLMTIYWQTGRHKEAENAYQNLIDGFPRSPVSQLARVQYKQWINIQHN